MQPPVAPRRPHAHELHGVRWDDEWSWLRGRDDPEVLAYLTAENAYAEEVLAGQDQLREAVLGEIRLRTQETDVSAPLRHGGWWYQVRTIEGLDYGVTLRWPAVAGGAQAAWEDPGADDALGGTRAGEEVVLDANAEAQGHDFFDLGVLEPSPDHRLVAWSRDTEGGEVFELRFRDPSRGVDLDDVIPRTSPSVAWSADSRHVLYTVPDAAMRPHQVWRHELGTPADADGLVHTEPDERFSLQVETTRSRAFVVVSAHSMTTTEVWVLPADDLTADPRVVEPRQADHEYSVDHRGEHFVILTNLDAEDFRVVVAPVDDPGRATWRDVLPHRPGHRVNDVAAFRDHVVVSEWSEGLPRLRVLFDDGSQRLLDHDDAVWDVGLSDNPEFESPSFRFVYTSFAVPTSVYREDAATGQRHLLKRQPVLGDVDLNDYRTARTWATALDGTKVPISLVHHRDVAPDATAPLLLYGYGAYEATTPPWFSIARLSLLDRGVVFAIAHVRGGGELGRHWYLDGKLRHKPNSFLDLIAAARHLMAEGWAAPPRLAIRGASAGGLLVGAAFAMEPALFAAVVAEVPFVDCTHTLLDPSLPLTVTEWEEWGDPRDPDDFAVIRSYTPYDNVPPGPLPAMYVTAGLNDPRVGYHEPAKWVAKLRATAAPSASGSLGGPLVLRTELGAGHGGPSGRYARWRDEARVLAFVLHALGVTGA